MKTSKTLSEYKDQFGNFRVPSINELMQDSNRMREYQLLIDPDFKRRHGYQVYIDKFVNEGRIVNYKVLVGPFIMKIVVLHHPGKAPPLVKDNRIGKGAFGVISVRKMQNTEFVIKAISFRTKETLQDQILEGIREVAMTKLCSFLKIGPRTETRIPFDLVCYEDRFQFHLELCKPVEDRLSLSQE